MNDLVEKTFEETSKLHLEFARTNKEKIAEIAEAIVKIFKRGNKILLFGNGGSAADCQHMAAEFVNRFRIERDPLPAIALTTDTSIITSIANDYDYSKIFSKQIDALGNKGDIALGISTSGRSPNIIDAFKTARQKGLTVIAFSGKGGEHLRETVDHLLIVDSESTPRIQEVQTTLAHIICEIVETKLFSSCTSYER